MRKTSVRELHIHTSELVRAAEEGGVIIIERRGQPVAELRPLSPQPTLSPEKKARIFAKMQKFWDRQAKQDNSRFTDSTDLVSEDRDR